jgi:hypothetical protein
MRRTAWWWTGVLVGCIGGGQTVADDQLRGVSVLLDGQPLFHDAPADEASSWSTPPTPIAFYDGAFRPLDVFGPWGTLEVEGPAFTLYTDSLGQPEFLACETDALGRYDGALILTHPDQPGRTFRVAVSCTVDDALRAVPLSATAVDDDGTVYGRFLGDQAPSTLARWSAGSGLVDTGVAADLLAPRVASQGFVALTDDVGGPRSLFTYDGQDLVQTVQITDWGHGWATRDGAVYRSADHLRVVQGFSDRIVADLDPIDTIVAVPPSGSHAVMSQTDFFGETVMRLVDLADGSEVPFGQPDGSPWFDPASRVHVRLSDDLGTLTVASAAFLDVSLRQVDLASGTVTERFDPVETLLLERAPRANGLPVKAFDMTPDGTHAVAVVEAIRADSGGFRLEDQIVVVTELATGALWLANTGFEGEDVKLGDGFDGLAVETVALSPGAEKVVVNGIVQFDRSVWRPLP